MAGIDVLLTAALNIEKVHQVVLAQLVEHTCLLEALGINGEVEKVELEPQGGLYDLEILVKGTDSVFVELKIDASLSEDQISRQLKVLEPGDTIIYIIIGITRFLVKESDIQAIKHQLGVNCNVKVISLQNIISALGKTVEDNYPQESWDYRDLAFSYLGILRAFESLTKNYVHKPKFDWNHWDWYGFYADIQNKTNKDMSIGYIANPSGGFIGSWWNWTELAKLEGKVWAYLQVEQDKLCFKIWVENPEKQSLYRNQLHEKLMTTASQTQVSISRPKRFGKGRTMTIAHLAGDYRGVKDLLDWLTLQDSIETAEMLMNKSFADLV